MSTLPTVVLTVLAVLLVAAALRDVFDTLFHETGLGKFFVVPERGRESFPVLDEDRLERAIGVIYRPATERCVN